METYCKYKKYQKYKYGVPVEPAEYIAGELVGCAEFNSKEECEADRTIIPIIMELDDDNIIKETEE